MTTAARTFALTITASASLPTWATNISVGSWGVASSNTLASQSPGTALPLRQIDGVFAYSGGAFASGYSTHGALLIHGGGHNDYYGNEVYAFDLTTGAWTLCGSTYPTVPGDNPNPPNADGELTGSVNGSRPAACHTVNCLQYIPGSVAGNTKGLLVRPNAFSVANTVGSYTSRRSHAFNLDTNLWSRFFDAVSPTGGTLLAGSTAYDSANNVIWWMPQGTFAPRKLTAGGVWSTSSVTPIATNYTANSVYVPTVGKIFVFEPGASPWTVSAITVATNALQTVTPSGGPVVQGASGLESPGVAWCGDLGKILVYPYFQSAGVLNRGTIFTFDPVTLTWGTLVTSTTAVPGAYGGVYGRFQYAPSVKCAIVAPTVNSNVFAFKVA